MILKASQRGNGSELALHLLNERDNDHIQIHDIDGFIADTVGDALKETEALSLGTKCKQYLFSVSLSPPKDAKATEADFENAIDRIAHQFHLENQPKVVIFHEKNARRHCHVVFSRINADTMTAVPLPYYKNRLMALSRDLYFEHGWDLPRGFIDRQHRDQLNFTVQEYQQAKREKHDPRVLKAALKDCWERSDSAKAFDQALRARGFALARGDRRGHVAVDWRGKIYSLSRWLDKKNKAGKKELEERLGSPDTLKPTTDVIAAFDQRLQAQTEKFLARVDDKFTPRLNALQAGKARQKERHENERNTLQDKHAAREQAERRIRLERLNKGMRAVWDRITGRHARIIRANEMEALESFHRDRDERDALTFKHIAEKQAMTEHYETLECEYLQHRMDVQNAVFGHLPKERVAKLERELAPAQPNQFSHTPTMER